MLTTDGNKNFSPEPRTFRNIAPPDETTRYADEFVALDADGDLRGYDIRADYRFVGVNTRQATASATRQINGEVDAIVANAGGKMGNATVTGLAAGSEGKRVYASAADALTLTPTHPMVPAVGSVRKVLNVAATKADVMIRPESEIASDIFERHRQAAVEQARFFRAEDFRALPHADANDCVLDLQGTNAAAITHAAGGGWNVTTDTAGNDQSILIGEASGALLSGGLTPNRAAVCVFEFETGGSIADREIWTGLTLTGALDGTTDADKLVIQYDSAGADANFRVIHSVGGADSTPIDTGVACAVSTKYALAIVVTAAGKGEVYLGANGSWERVASDLTMTAAAVLKPLFAVETLTTAAASGQIVRRFDVSMDYAA